MLGYALQNALLVRYARKIDGLSLAFYRNISYVITLLPLLLLSSKESIVGVLTEWPILLIAGITGALSLVFRFVSYRFVPLGVSHSITKVITAAILTLLGWVIFKEHLSQQTLLIIGILLALILWLGLQKNPMPHLDDRAALGIALAALASAPLACTIFLFLWLSKTIDPYASAYFWEVSIAGGTVLLLLGKQVVTGVSLERISSGTFLKIVGASSPVLFGTGASALAILYGPVGVLSAIQSVSLVIGSLLAWWWYGENLKRNQWLAIAAIVVCSALLKMIS